MIVECETCGSKFEDEYRTYICPHEAFPANNGDNTFTVHKDAYLHNSIMTKTCPVCHGELGNPPLRSFNGVDVCSPECCSVLINQKIALTNGSVYDADYFLRGKESGKSLYTNYQWLPQLTIPMVRAIVQHCGIKKQDHILDFGCARGYMVRAFREEGYFARGYDVSKWAIENADETVYHYLTSRPELALIGRNCDWVIAKDVLEHVENVDMTVDTLKGIAKKGVFVVVPLAHCKGEYDVPEYEMDVTHIHRRPLQWWVGHFHQEGWAVEGQYRVEGVKDNYAQYPTGNGFITCRRIEQRQPTLTAGELAYVQGTIDNLKRMGL